MRVSRALFIFFLISTAFLWQNCIHEYPVAQGNSGIGEDPETVSGYIELNYDLSWQYILHSIDFSTKSGNQKNHRLIVEVSKDGETVIHDTHYIDDTEFATGKFRRKLSIPLEAKRYEIAAWYDRIDDNGTEYFKADKLSDISIKNHSTTDTLAFQCAFSADVLDLTGYAKQREETIVVKELDMQLPGSRFQIVATDVQDFILEQKEALNQGDKFTTCLDFKSGGNDVFSAYSQRTYSSSDDIRLSGWMRLPFAEYDELIIGQGFVFCEDEGTVAMRVSIKNSALLTVSETAVFTFPIKRGYITVVKGDFLTHPIDGTFKVDHIWSGEIIYEI